MHPGEWKKTPSPDQNLMSFNKYIRIFERYLNITNLVTLAINKRWDLLICTGGDDMEDLICHQTTIEVREIPAVVVDGCAVPSVIDIPAIHAMAWDAGILLCPAAITKHTN